MPEEVSGFSSFASSDLRLIALLKITYVKFRIKPMLLFEAVVVNIALLSRVGQLFFQKSHRGSNLHIH